MFRPTVEIRGTFLVDTLELVQKNLASPHTVVMVDTNHRHNIVIIREQFAKILLALEVPFSYDGPHIVLPNGSRFAFNYERGASPLVVTC